LAVSFALVALTPLASFQQLAFALGAGVVVDAFLVRSLLVPALITLVGPVSGWPGRRLTPHVAPVTDPGQPLSSP
jgi:putative drug exporter of the RND superfamily